MTNKRLYKSTTDRVIFGVCGGIAEYFDADSAIIRLLMVIFALMGGTGILFYIFAAIIMQKRYAPETANRRSAGDPGPGGAETHDDAFSDMRAAGTADAANAGAVPPAGTSRPRAGGGRGSGAVIFGLILIILGLFYLIDRFVPIFHWIDFRSVFAAVMVLLGIYFVAKR
jgi:phage shock protein C